MVVAELHGAVEEDAIGAVGVPGTGNEDIGVVGCCARKLFLGGWKWLVQVVAAGGGRCGTASGGGGELDIFVTPTGPAVGHPELMFFVQRFCRGNMGVEVLDQVGDGFCGYRRGR